MYKLSAYYHAYVKQELPYYGIGKTNEEIYDILIDAHLNLDDDLIEFMDDNNSINDTEGFNEEDNLIISDVLNLDVNEFIKNLDKIIEDSIEENRCNIQDILESKVTNDIE